MADDYGACVVLIPGPNMLPDTVDGGQHITLAYFGDETLSVTNHQNLTAIVSRLATSMELELLLEVKGEELFGENEDAHVITFDASSQSTAVILRNMLLKELTPELAAIFRKAETWPDYQPHMTLGYLDDGYEGEELEDLPGYLPISMISVWNGNDHLNFPLNDEAMKHYGTPRKSGRYPWGSGGEPNQRGKSFLDYVAEMKKAGMSDVEIANGMGIKTTELRARKSIAKTELRRENADTAIRLKEKGMSNVAIAKQMGLNESSVRALLDPHAQERNDMINNTADMLRRQVAEKEYIDIGKGAAALIGISNEKLNSAVAVLKEEGYHKYYIKEPQLGTGKDTTYMVLAKPDATYRDVYTNRDKIRLTDEYTNDHGRTMLGIVPPIQISSDRLKVRYAEEGGGDADGVIYVRRGKEDISMGNARYAQVRIAIDGTHYLKGMAIYKDDLPDGVDLMFNTNKSNTGNKLDALKKLKTDKATGDVDQDNPFGAVIHQLKKLDANGQEIPGTVRSAMNIVNEEGDWNKWSKSLSSQMLSKQSPSLAKEQLSKTFEAKQREYDEIMSLTNPVVRKKLLQSFADSVDSSAEHLKAAGLPRQRTQVILPIESMKDTEVYAPNFRNGEKVVLIRYPHGGTFEIPELTVNNNHPEGKRTLGPRNKEGGAIDAIGISPKTAARLSGADFDGDTVLVIPNNSRKVKTSAPLEGLKGFDPQVKYKGFEGMPVMTAHAKAKQMGDVSNLITDMTIKGAPHSEIVRAVRHSMVVIDAEKHKLNYKQSYEDNGIADLKRRYQGGPKAGANTLISKASSEQRVGTRKLRRASQGGAIDPKTGEKVYEYTNETYTDRKGKVQPRTVKSSKMAEARDARELISKDRTVMETIYADHANKLKALANKSRKSLIETKTIPYSPSAKAAYKDDVTSLDAKLRTANMNKPRERQAQLLANATLHAKKQANPDMDAADEKKIKSQALKEARHRTGAEKSRIKITDREWAAIQAGAITTSKLSQILENADLDRVKELATPRSKATVMTPTVKSKAKAMIAAGHTAAEVADALGINVNTLNSSLSEEG